MLTEVVLPRNLVAREMNSELSSETNRAPLLARVEWRYEDRGELESDFGVIQYSESGCECMLH